MNLSPLEIGLPPKFDKWRSGQEAGVRAILESPKRHTVVSAPTGWGKSAAVVGAALASGKRTCIVTSTRGLADQYNTDFSECGLVDIRGLANYECSLKPDYTCQEGKAVRCPYWGTIQCPYSQTEMRAATSRLLITNYAKWTSFRKNQSCLDNIEMLILDEAHESPEALASAMEVVLHYKEMEDISVPFLNGVESQEMWNWKEWAKAARNVCENEAIEAKRKLDSPNLKLAWIRRYNHLKNLLERLATIALANSRDWICEETKEGWRFDPIRPARYAEGKLFCRVPRVIAVSATVRPKTMFMLGVQRERFDFHEYPSDFDASRCPVYHIPTMRMDHRQENFQPLYLRIDQIMGSRTDRKGLIQTVSWKQGGASTEEIHRHCRFSNYMLSNEQGKPASSYIEEFKKAPPPYVMISPSISTGYDFANDSAEYQILVKIPFQDGRSKIVKARQEDDRDYGPYNTMQSLVQRVGRIMRSKSDRGESILVDDHAQWFVKKYGHFAPANFHKFYRTVDIVPPAPPKL